MFWVPNHYLCQFLVVILSFSKVINEWSDLDGSVVRYTWTYRKMLVYQFWYCKIGMVLWNIVLRVTFYGWSLESADESSSGNKQSERICVDVLKYLWNTLFHDICYSSENCTLHIVQIQAFLLCFMPPFVLLRYCLQWNIWIYVFIWFLNIVNPGSKL